MEKFSERYFLCGFRTGRASSFPSTEPQFVSNIFVKICNCMWAFPLFKDDVRVQTQDVEIAYNKNVDKRMIRANHLYSKLNVMLVWNRSEHSSIRRT